MQKGKIKKVIKPSQREAITDFSAHIGSGISYEDKLRGKKIVSAVFIAICIIALIYAGFFFTDVLIRFTEIQPAMISLNPEAISIWISSLTIPV